MVRKNTPLIYFKFILTCPSGTLTDWGSCALNPNPVPSSTGNFYVPSPKQKTGEGVDSVTIFIRTDCITRIPLDLFQQDPLTAKHPELLLNRGTIASYLTNYLNTIPSGLSGTAIDPNGGQGGNSDTFSLVISNSTSGLF